MKSLRLLTASFMLVGVIAGTGVSQTPAPKSQSPTDAKSTVVKLRLNGQDAGTTDDLSVLTGRIKEIFGNRGDQGILKPGTNEIERTVMLGGDRSVPSETIAGLYGALTDSGADPLLVPVPAAGRVRPNPLLLYLHAGTGEIPMVNSGMPIGFIGELFENRFAEWSNVAITANKDGSYSIGGKPMAVAALKSELAVRVKALPKGSKVVFLLADTYGSVEEIAKMAAAAGATKLYVVTKNQPRSENGISFSLSPAFAKDTSQEPIPGISSLTFKRPDSWSFEITVNDDLMEPERLDAEIASEFESRKKNYTDASVFMDEIGGSNGVMTIQKDEGYSAYWIGSRKKGAKRQLVLIRFGCSVVVSDNCSERSAFTQSEFLQIKNSIRFE